MAAVLRRAFALLLAGRVREAEGVLAEAPSAPVVLQGRATLRSLVALLSEQPEDVERALQAQDEAARKRTGNDARVRLLKGEADLFRACLHFRQGGILRGGFLLRSSFKHYSGVLQEAESLLGDGIDAADEETRLFVAASLFGGGFFLFGCSLIPQQYHWLVEAIGFSVDRHQGLELLSKCERLNTAWSPMASLALLFIENFFFEDTKATRQRLDALQGKLDSPLLQFVMGYAERKSGDIEGSAQSFLGASECAMQLKQFSLSCLCEAGQSYFLMNRWDVAAATLEEFLQQTKAPSYKCYASLQYAQALMMLHQQDKAQFYLKQCLRTRRKGYSWDDYAARMAQSHLDSSCVLTEAQRMLIIVRNHVESLRFAEAAPLIDELLATSDGRDAGDDGARDENVYAQALFYRAKCQQSVESYEAVIEMCESVQHAIAETWIAPHAWVEMAEIHFQRGAVSLADECLRKAKSYSDFDFSKPLRRRISALEVRQSKTHTAIVMSNRVEDVESFVSADEEEEEEWARTVQKFRSQEADRQWVVSDEWSLRGEDINDGDDFETAMDSDSFSMDDGPGRAVASFDLVASLPRKSVQSGKNTISGCVSVPDALACLSEHCKSREEALGILFKLIDSKALSFLGPSSSIKSLAAFSQADLKQCHVHFDCSRFLNCRPDPIRSTVDARVLMREIFAICKRFVDQSERRFHLSSLVKSPIWDRLQSLVSSLAFIDRIAAMKVCERRSFWCSCYSLLAFHAQIHGTVPTSGKKRKFFRGVHYNIAGNLYSLDDIEHGILRGNAKHMSLTRQFTPLDPRMEHVLPLDPLIHFPLSSGVLCGGVLDIGHEDALLQCAKTFLMRTVRLDGSRLNVPRIFKYYPADFGGDAAAWIVALLQWERVNPGKLSVSYCAYDMTSIGMGDACEVVRS